MEALDATVGERSSGCIGDGCGFSDGDRGGQGTGFNNSGN